MSLELGFTGQCPGADNQGPLRAPDSEPSPSLGITHYFHRADKGMLLMFFFYASVKFSKTASLIHHFSCRTLATTFGTDRSYILRLRLRCCLSPWQSRVLEKLRMMSLMAATSVGLHELLPDTVCRVDPFFFFVHVQFCLNN
jgi:hypothetical protein